MNSNKTLALGKNFHVTVVTATFSNGELQSGVNYQYNLTFEKTSDSQDSRPNQQSLNELFSGENSLGYDGETLPTFALPPQDLSKLNIVHGSCRLPHGEGTDMFPLLDHLIEISHGDPQIRPHQLFLTGDQIYADDVAPALLRMAGSIGNHVLGWEEALPFTGKDSDGTTILSPTTTHFALAPYRRKRICDVYAGFSSENSHSHVMTLGEYYGMYLLVWSDALWPRDINNKIVTPFLEEVFDHSEKPWLENWWKNNDEWDDAQKVFNKSEPPLLRFGRGLSKVRRALANIPSYMTPDDHEVTDDWNLHKKWQENVLEKPLGRRILQNSLCAYAVFQGWGNDPGHFSQDQPGGELLKKLTEWKGLEAFNSIAPLLDLPPNTANINKPRWHFHISYFSHQVIGLDTRTHREFPSGDKERAAGLIDMASLTQQIRTHHDKAKKFELTIVMSPMPIMSSEVEEFFKKPLGEIAKLYADREAWNDNPKAYQRFMHALVPFKHVMLLSGDVHHSFAIRIPYWDKREPTHEQRAVFLQLNCSGFQKEDRKTRAVGLQASLLGNLTIPKAVLGWNVPGPHVKERTESPRGTLVVDKSVRGELDYKTFLYPTILKTPQWAYQIEFAKDGRDTQKRGTYIPEQPDDIIVDHQLSWAKSSALEHNRLRNWEAYKIDVGKNNIALVQILHWTEERKEVRQSIWYIPYKGGKVFDWEDDEYVVEHSIPLPKPYTELNLDFSTPKEDLPLDAPKSE